MAQVSADTAQYSFAAGGATFGVLTFAAHEEISTLFQYELTLWSEDVEVDIEALIREKAEITIRWGDLEKTMYGIVSKISQTDVSYGDRPVGRYKVEVVPKFWLLTRYTNCRIFQRMAVDEIIKSVLDDRGLDSVYDFQLQESYEKREYCVQYRETDFDFLQRLMEEEGIFFFFTHDDEEKLIFGDSDAAYGECAPQDSVQYKKLTGTFATTEEYIHELTYSEQAHSGSLKWQDYDFREPEKQLLVERSLDRCDDLAVYDYHPERYRADTRGRTLGQIDLETRGVMGLSISGTGSWRSFSAGGRFTLENAYRSALNREWVVVSLTHTATQGEQVGTSYQVKFVAIPSDVVFRSRRGSLKPQARPQTAYVVGPTDEKIYMDELGRAKVQFHWDAEGENNEDSSCWIRVAQPYAGLDDETSKQHGFQWHPLIGDEVVVDFLEGDIDRPLIVGSVYNGRLKPLVKPEEHIRNMILSPYQHRLLMDDKNACLHLNTGGHEHLDMFDKTRADEENEGDSEGRVILATCGDEVLAMEDASDEFGNTISLSTADDHRMIFYEKDEKRGIIIQTQQLNTVSLLDEGDIIEVFTAKKNMVVLNDEKQFIHLQTTDGHSVLLDDAEERIVILSRDSHRMEISDKDNFIEIADASGEHRFRIDMAESQLTIATDSGNIAIQAPTGTVAIEAQTVEVNAESAVNVECGNLWTKAQGEITTEATNITHEAGANFEVKALAIKQKANADIKMEGLNITSKASMNNKAQGTMVNSQASGINTIKGSLVKIN